MVAPEGSACMNLLDLPASLPLEEWTEILHDSGGARIERIVSTGQTTGWYNQCEDEFVMLLSGQARLEYEDGSEEVLTEGDAVFLPAHKKHRVAFTSKEPPCIWLCVFMQ